MSVSLDQDAGGYGYSDKLNCAIANLEPRPVRASPYRGPWKGKGSRTTPLTTTKPTEETTRFTKFHRAAMACVSLGMLLASSPALADETADAVAAMRAAAERFQDVEVALAEGYVRDPANHCFTAGMMGMPPEWGVMGIHYFRPDLLGVTATEPKVDGNGLHLDWDKPVDPDLRAAGRRRPRARRGREPRLQGGLGGCRQQRAAEAARPHLGPHGRQPGHRGPRRGARFRRALRPARLGVPRQPERRPRALQSRRHLRASHRAAHAQLSGSARTDDVAGAVRSIPRRGCVPL